MISEKEFDEKMEMLAKHLEKFPESKQMKWQIFIKERPDPDVFVFVGWRRVPVRDAGPMYAKTFDNGVVLTVDLARTNFIGRPYTPSYTFEGDDLDVLKQTVAKMGYTIKQINKFRPWKTGHGGAWSDISKPSGWDAYTVEMD